MNWFKIYFCSYRILSILNSCLTLNCTRQQVVFSSEPNFYRLDYYVISQNVVNWLEVLFVLARLSKISSVLEVEGGVA